MKESAIPFFCDGQNLLGILHQPTNEVDDIGVLVVVGGPQYRVGSHRQFVQLARFLANNNIACFRFDYTGMGDSAGIKKTFDNVGPDIRSAIDVFIEQANIKQVVLWALCDGASAALIYAPTDERVKAVMLLNPWLESPQAKAKTMLKHYYLNRLVSKSFWTKLVSGQFKAYKSLKAFLGYAAHQHHQTPNEQSNQSYQARMIDGYLNFSGSSCFVLSGDDLTAREFEQVINSNSAKHQFYAHDNLIHRIKDADHTFSQRLWKREVEVLTVDFVKQLEIISG
ncbi:hydrolase 1, exosortase A system-associated [Thalassotalea maritima]|uniref:hydrolase 1, exosortase A system-associated n=1 Tax=Thalassotalea maritima TaxID=3242416 RepID=UPI003528F19A